MAWKNETAVSQNPAGTAEKCGPAAQPHRKRLDAGATEGNSAQSILRIVGGFSGERLAHGTRRADDTAGPLARPPQGVPRGPYSQPGVGEGPWLSLIGGST